MNVNEESKKLNSMLGRKEKVVLPELPYEGATGALKSIYEFLSEVRISSLPEYHIKNGELYRPAGWWWVRPATKLIGLEKKVEDSEVAKKLGKIIPDVSLEVEKGIRMFGNSLDDLDSKLQERDKRIEIAIDYSGSCYREELIAIQEVDKLILQKEKDEKRERELKDILGKGNSIDENVNLMTEYDSLIRNEIVLRDLHERAKMIASAKRAFKRDEDKAILTGLEMQRKGHAFVSKGRLIIESTQNVLSHADLNMSSMSVLFGAYKSLQVYSPTPQLVTNIADMSDKSVVQLFGLSLPSLPQS